MPTLSLRQCGKLRDILTGLYDAATLSIAASHKPDGDAVVSKCTQWTPELPASSIRAGAREKMASTRYWRVGCMAYRRVMAVCIRKRKGPYSML